MNVYEFGFYGFDVGVFGFVDEGVDNVSLAAFGDLFADKFPDVVPFVAFADVGADGASAGGGVFDGGDV